MKKTSACFTLAALLALSVAMPAAERGKPAQVTIDNFSFTPPALTIQVGTTVEWTNRDDVPHTVVSTTRQFASQVMDTEQHYSRTFDTPGTYEYYCSVHPHMKGKIVVQ